ncbi:hypothetical protein [Paenibacillus wynnii]|uniref:hypothetical protein n=1 Tax=Paenibacillus wynnii TaxID=268407 RepID=UPI000AA13FE3|nr:hypothetical protein [Paenibacillus wynnii]
MPKNSADPKYDRADNKADRKEYQQSVDNFTKEAKTVTSEKAADYVPSLNNVPKNEI